MATTVGWWDGWLVRWSIDLLLYVWRWLCAWLRCASRGRKKKRWCWKLNIFVYGIQSYSTIYTRTTQTKLNTLSYNSNSRQQSLNSCKTQEIFHSYQEQECCTKLKADRQPKSYAFTTDVVLLLLLMLLLRVWLSSLATAPLQMPATFVARDRATALTCHQQRWQQTLCFHDATNACNYYHCLLACLLSVAGMQHFVACRQSIG